MALSEALRQRVAAEFPEGDWGRVEQALESYGALPHEREPERVKADILALARGDLQEVLTLVARARRDYRDILFWAEYPRESRLDNPEKIAAFEAMCRRFGASLPPLQREARSGKRE